MIPHRVLLAAPAAGEAAQSLAALPALAVQHVTDAAAALAALASAPFAAVVIDHALDTDLALVAAVRDCGHDLPVLALTAAGDEAMAVRAIERGATDFVTTAGELSLRMAALLARPRRMGNVEERFRSLFEHSPTILWEEDGSALKRELDRLRASGIDDMRAYLRANPSEVGRLMGLVKVLDVNQASLRHYGAANKAELLAGLDRTLAPESQEMIIDQLASLAAGALLFEAETTTQTLGGQKCHVLLKTLVAPGSEQTLANVYVSIVDITARKEAEQQVRALALFPQLNPMAVLQLSADGTIAYANPASRALAASFDATIESLLPESVPALVHEMLDTGRPHRGLETRRGARTLSWSFHPVLPQQIVHCYAVDITEQLLLEEAMRQAHKLDAIGHLAGGIAHDFNNLLTVIYANTALLQRQQPSPGLELIATASDRAASLVRQLLAFSRQQVLATTELDLNAAVVNLAPTMTRGIREDIKVQLDLADEPVWTRADAAMLDQVLLHLVANARDAMPGGGALTVSTSRQTLGDPSGVPELPPGEYACLRVRDTGVGIAPEDLARVFDPFFTTKEQGKGTGLGLATVFGIVKQHNGALTVASELGAGATFTVLLPAARAYRRATTPVAP